MAGAGIKGMALIDGRGRAMCVVALSLFVCFFSFRGEYWRAQWIAVSLAASIPISVACFRRFGLAASVAFVYVLFSGLCALDEYANIQPAMGTLMTTAGVVYGALFSFLIVVAGVLCLSDDTLDTLEQAVPYLVFALSLYSVWQWFLGYPLCGLMKLFGWDLMHQVCAYRSHSISGFCRQASMAGSFVAALAPLCFRHRPALIMCGLAVLVHATNDASIPIGVFAVSTLSYLLLTKRLGARSLALGGLLLALGLGALIHANPLLFDSSQRFQFYRIDLAYWFTHLNTIGGTGTGTHFFLGPQIQCAHKFMTTDCQRGHWWGFMHSDILQVLFEQGAIGLGLVSLVVVDALKKSFHREQYQLTACLLGYVAMSVFDFPQHFGPHAFLGAFLLAACLTSPQRSAHGGFQH